RSNVGEVVEPAAIFQSKISLGVGAKPLFPPLDQALIHAMACEVVAETEEPLSRQSLADLVRRSQTTLGKKISRSTVWRIQSKTGSQYRWRLQTCSERRRANQSPNPVSDSEATSPSIQMGGSKTWPCR